MGTLRDQEFYVCPVCQEAFLEEDHLDWHFFCYELYCLTKKSDLAYSHRKCVCGISLTPDEFPTHFRSSGGVYLHYFESILCVKHKEETQS